MPKGKAIVPQARRVLRKDPTEPRDLKIPNFRCLHCDKKFHHTEMDFRQRRASCTGCAPDFPEDRVEGPWRQKSGEPRPVATLAE